ncbi:hypothetical protein [Streptomyces justiciae]|uniref:hypothetical protein n=1 Tax=Streptomyces justiciae TaxID=2780140 RepID=UPI002118A539|nr:hypothetical protein [Streptomyces justiciae]MCW8384639.1 hypothetical protein [Streptomyces justiciae]
MNRSSSFWVSAAATLALVGGGATLAVAGSDEDVPPPAPAWVGASGAVDTSALPTEAPELLPDGRPNINALNSDNGDDSTTVDNLPGTEPSDRPTVEGEPDTQELGWELPQPTCEYKPYTGTTFRTSVNHCSREDGTFAVNGSLQDSVADGKCTSMTVYIGSYTRTWKVCDGQTVRMDTGFQTGTSAVWAYRSGIV